MVRQTRETPPAKRNRIVKATWYSNDGLRTEISGGSLVFLVRMLGLSMTIDQKREALNELQQLIDKASAG